MSADIRYRLGRLRRDERGMALVWVSLGFMTFLAAGTLAIDVGVLMTARTQAQASADAGALAGATALVKDSWDDRSAGGPAVQSAITTAQKNVVMSANVSVQPGDVTFPTGPTGLNNRVKVNVFRTADRSNPLALLIGSLIGVPNANITATATAQADTASSMTCVKPFIIPDKWQENSSPPWTTSSTFDRYDNHDNIIPNADVYVPGSTDQGGTGYSRADIGMTLTLRAGTGGNIAPSSYFSWEMPGGSGGSWYESNIVNCNETPVSVGDNATQEPGNMVGPTIDGLTQLLNKDPDAYWDSTNKKVVSQFAQSPRLFPIPLYNPDVYQFNNVSGRTATYVVTAFLPFFLQSISGNSASGVLASPIITSVQQPSTSTTSNTLIYTVRLVQ